MKRARTLPADLVALAASPAADGIDELDGLSVVIPAYNEQAGIEEVLHQIVRVLTETGLPFELIVVDDGSQDQTAEIATKSSVARVIRHRRNRGYGAALKTGIRQARYELVCITDADGTYPNEMIPVLTDRLVDNHLDMVVGARTGENVAIPLARRPAKWVISQLAQIVAGEKIPDINSGLRVFRRTVALRFFNLLPDGFSFTTTITLGMLTNGYAVEYVPIDYFARKGHSKIRPLRDTARFIQLVLQIALYFSPMKIFYPLGILIFFTGLAWGVGSYLLFGRIADASTVMILITAVQIIVIGLLADLINRRLPGYQKEETGLPWDSDR